ncbi:DEAD/DEAH box helicase [Roseovarius nubinhibens]|uniref:Helicase ATP-binding domain-containing protein n=1 Tax=Roseovarius nubinhibens (strain ATCC BAA-591 / DSM 15170 / ISM) TaxID=89187 RepID=A3SLB1_ROSNI|nr:DEAD/DEAH box helicase family protein [Roseovarius nubinhibens]EAP78142.1 hypothetical protein ISM_07595 [Roseovarius nubinhibens ISM]
MTNIPELDKIGRAVAQRLSLRPPQSESLAILGDVATRVADELGGLKDADTADVLRIVQDAYPHVTDFERDFPSLSFALATGVGKTRLMGAFIAWLREAGISRHFLVLAPNLTIYDKLKLDFTPGTPKYVFKGLPVFATSPPVLVTGDDYEDGRGVRAEDGLGTGQGQLGFEGDTIINVFNISKINADKDARGVPRVRRLQEYIGESYFDYLAGLDDLVLLMDEAHRYRASAGAKAINALKPILGLELTATPKAAGAGGQDFKNVVYGYSLGQAMRDGFVKEPAVATRENFDPSGYNDEELDRIKLQDGVTYHEKVKADLEVFARSEGVARVKPFVLVVAKDTTHAGELETYIKSEDFFDGRYADRVIQVHSNLKGEMKDESIARLLQIESPDERTEIVIHVNKLGEGWDVTNLFTIVPLRASASDILTEQTIGRGLRLPYGKRTGNETADTLTIIAHERFQAIVDAAQNPESLIKKSFTIGEGGTVSRTPEVPVHVPSRFESMMTGERPGFGKPEMGGEVARVIDSEKTQGATGEETSPPPVLATPEARKTAAAIFKLTSTPGSHMDVTDPTSHTKIVAAVKESAAQSPDLFGEGGSPEEADIRKVLTTIAEHAERESISIPRVVVVPKDDVSFGYNDFEPKDLSQISYTPLEENIIVQEIRTGKRRPKIEASAALKETRPEDYILRAMLDHGDIDYDEHAELLQKLTSAVVDHLRSYLPDDDAVEKVAYQFERPLAGRLVEQMRQHRWNSPTEYEARVTKGTATLKPLDFTAPSDAPLRPFSYKPGSKEELLRTLFTGFKRALYPIQKFHSDPERQFAEALEHSGQIMKWMKPARKQMQIEWGAGQYYEPDFVVETANEKWLVEIKMRKEMSAEDVVSKAEAAMKWCEHASTHESAFGGKPWVYMLVPDDEVAGATPEKLRQTHARKVAKSEMTAAQ